MMTRRDFVRGALAASPLFFEKSAARAADAVNKLGVCTYSYQLHWTAAKQSRTDLPFRDAIGFVEHCHRLGAGGVQIVVGPWEAGSAAKLRAKAASLGMYVEGQVALPHEPEEVERFDVQLRTAREAGMDVVRAVCLSGRRYETLSVASDWPPFVERSRTALRLAEPVARKHRIRLAIENHKDWRVPELLNLLKGLGSEFVGVCLDTGNSIALLEEPHAVVDALAPVTFTTHFKDMAVEESVDGFRLAEVPLGDGYLDLGRIVAAVRRANPSIRFNLEMITRDPLSVPCLTDRYWATMDGVPGRDVARSLATVRSRASKQPLPRVSKLSDAEKLKREDDNVRRCFAYARERLGI
jgi:sugar phosphate isomerase/epimerase